jgi:hypothetical protein
VPKSELKDFLPPNEGVQHFLPPSRKRKKYPSGWEPSVLETENYVEAVSGHFERPTDETELIEAWNLNSNEWFIVPGTLLVNRWQMAGEWQYQYKAKLERLSAPRLDADELLKNLKNFKPPKTPASTSETAFLVCLSDFQIGKADGDGTEGTVRRILQAHQRIVARAKQLKPSSIYVVGMGDLVENCDGHYPSQTFTVELDRRQQVRVVRRLIRDLVVDLSRLGIPMVVSGVAGNHGENRKDGKAFTGPGDNDDVAVFEMIAEALQTNEEAFGHVSFYIPDDRLELLLEIYGWRVGFHHGHIAGRGATPQQKQQNWWKDHAFQGSLIGDADYLVTGHYHHLSVVDHGPRVHFQCPAMDGGSRWWEERGGGISKSGILTLTIDANGWDNLRVL